MATRLPLSDTEADVLATILYHVGGSPDGLALVAAGILANLLEEHGARASFGHLVTGSIKISQELEMAS
ncbi:hypothetical protein [Fodinicola feengrottensis]|uniref:Uncharacterized protein n=1 Tax=Fodinicola feengrottensis TaxID=435914 RepID=A0ABP4U9A7_9ACTN|nr:hypothetical protein [Fodinicola feengrottensis]